MSNPKDVFRRAGKLRELSEEAFLTDDRRKPEIPVGKSDQGNGMPVRIVVPQPIRENSVYRQLMRSHDRMHTRHIKG